MFSAVLSAFLIESYKSLQPDTDTQIAAIVQTLASQMNPSTPQFINVASIPLASDFKAPLWAVRVNALWFASLIVSLAVASLGMLVQSWLREYLAEEWISPQEKLRARQYRHPAMVRWKVFKIAAALPLLLQISLGLFFLGLCFFTAEVDPRMGNTSLPLVVAWAFFLLVTTVAPLVSPRCPYKVPLLKHIMRFGRRYPMRFLLGTIRSYRPGTSRSRGENTFGTSVGKQWMSRSSVGNEPGRIQFSETIFSAEAGDALPASKVAERPGSCHLVSRHLRAITLIFDSLSSRTARSTRTV